MKTMIFTRYYIYQGKSIKCYAHLIHDNKIDLTRIWIRLTLYVYTERKKIHGKNLDNRVLCEESRQSNNFIRRVLWV